MTRTLVQADELTRTSNLVIYHTGVVLLDTSVVCTLVSLPMPSATLPPIRRIPDWMPRTLQLTCSDAERNPRAVILKRGVMGGDVYYISAHYRVLLEDASRLRDFAIEVPQFGPTE